jgi:hypothetical protein
MSKPEQKPGEQRKKRTQNTGCGHQEQSSQEKADDLRANVSYESITQTHFYCACDERRSSISSVHHEQLHVLLFAGPKPC